MKNHCSASSACTFVRGAVAFALGTLALPGIFTPQQLAGAEPIPAAGSKLPAAATNKVITAADVTVERVRTSIPVSAVGEPGAA
ncbi:MAG: hypothetical protein ABIO94_01505 [Opitutaceae bacterium]